MSDLPILYQRIADITSPLCASGKDECAQFCDRKYRCCERQYCEAARTFAKEKYGVTLQGTGNPDLPFMGDQGCTVAPHLRPVCAIHLCSFSWAPVEKAPEGYRELREEILEKARKEDKLWQ